MGTFRGRMAHALLRRRTLPLLIHPDHISAHTPFLPTDCFWIGRLARAALRSILEAAAGGGSTAAAAAAPTRTHTPPPTGKTSVRSPATNLAIDETRGDDRLVPNVVLRGMVLEYRRVRTKEWEAAEAAWRGAMVGGSKEGLCAGLLKATNEKERIACACSCAPFGRFCFSSLAREGWIGEGRGGSAVIHRLIDRFKRGAFLHTSQPTIDRWTQPLGSIESIEWDEGFFLDLFASLPLPKKICRNQTKQKKGLNRSMASNRQQSPSPDRESSFFP